MIKVVQRNKGGVFKNKMAAVTSRKGVGRVSKLLIWAVFYLSLLSSLKKRPKI